MKEISIISIFLTFILFFSGCSVKSEIKKVSESKSHFDDAIYTGQKDFYKSFEKIESDKYRIFHQASSGFTTTSAIRNTAMQRATEFCKNINPENDVTKVSEHTGKPPYILGNFPKIEIIFACTQRKENILSDNQQNKYDDLEKIKKLYDNGILTEEEYLKEKKKLLE
ncbi:MAG: SHOCT domain-containing protein [Arcobacteraceae bacterium]